MRKRKHIITIVLLMLFMVLTACGEDKESKVEGPLYLTGGENAYSIIYDADLNKYAVSACKQLNQYLGGELTMKTDVLAGKSTEVGKYEILIGETNRSESIKLSKDLGEHDYLITVEGTKLVVVGGCDAAIVNAIKHLMQSSDFAVDGVVESDYSVSYDGADNRDEYIENPESFLCNWALQFDVPEWMNDYNEKLAAFADADGRMMSSFHRGDFIYYPENSIEGIISAIQMGADNVELDLRLTKDGVVVLMHDETLSDTTDWLVKKGKNGLPTSEYLDDWTFEELRQLRLCTNDGVMTDYLIPTFEEVLQVCKGRTTIRLDKVGVWDWGDDVYPLIRKYSAWDTCILPFNYSLSSQQTILNNIKTHSGVTDVLTFSNFAQSQRANWSSKLDSILAEGITPIVYWSGDNYISRPMVEEAGEYLEQIKGKVRIYANSQAVAGAPEVQSHWDYLYEHGVNFILIDNGLALQKYIVENFEPTEY